MKLFAALVAIALVLVGCDKQGAERIEAKLASAGEQSQKMERRMEQMEQRIQPMEERIQQLEESQKSVANWVLWKRVQLYCTGCLYSPPHVLSAYSTHTQCIIAATRLIEPGGETLSTDPVEIAYGNRRVTFYCLPPNVQAGMSQK